MYSIRKLVIVTLMLLVVTILLGDVWDPALGTGNWQSSQYRMYIYGTGESTTATPFIAEGVTHLNSINQGANADLLDNQMAEDCIALKAKAR